MADITKRGFDCDDDGEDGEDGERGRRGKRGRRGHRGHDGHDGHDGKDGHDGHTGPTGSAGTTGPTGVAGATGAFGPSAGALIGRQVFNAAGGGIYTPTPGTRRATVRGGGGGGGGGGVPAIEAPRVVAVSSGGNSGVSVETHVVAPPNTFLSGGPFVVGAGGVGGVGAGFATPGGDSSIVVNGVLITAPGGQPGQTGLFNDVPRLVAENIQAALGTNVDYQSSDLGLPGFALDATSGQGAKGGSGGSGTYGIGGNGGLPGIGGAVGEGNGAGGGGTSTFSGASNGGDGAPGIWIIEEYS